MFTVSPRRAGLLAVAVAFLALPAPTQAGFINGNFDVGLTGWQVSDPSFVIALNGAATFVRLNESPVATEVTLYQDITISPGSTVISFRLIETVNGLNTGFLPDAFNVSLLVPN